MAYESNKMRQCTPKTITVVRDANSASPEINLCTFRGSQLPGIALIAKNIYNEKQGFRQDCANAQSDVIPRCSHQRNCFRSSIVASAVLFSAILAIPNICFVLSQGKSSIQVLTAFKWISIRAR